MTEWTGHDGSSDCPRQLRGTRHKIEVIAYEKARDGEGETYVLSFDNCAYIGCWRNVAAWRVIEPTLDERLLTHLKCLTKTHLRNELIEELKERIAKND
jgi:hypothetical protein